MKLINYLYNLIAIKTDYSVKKFLAINLAIIIDILCLVALFSTVIHPIMIALVSILCTTILALLGIRSYDKTLFRKAQEKETKNN